MEWLSGGGEEEVCVRVRWRVREREQSEWKVEEKGRVRLGVERSVCESERSD